MIYPRAHSCGSRIPTQVAVPKNSMCSSPRRSSACDKCQLMLLLTIITLDNKRFGSAGFPGTSDFYLDLLHFQFKPPGAQPHAPWRPACV